MRAHRIGSWGAVAAVVAACLTSAPAVAQDPEVTTRPDGSVTYVDPSVDGATRTVTGTLLTVPSESPGGAEQHLVQESDGTLVPITLAPDVADDLSVGRVRVSVSTARTARVARLSGTEPAAAATPTPTANRVYLAVETGVLSTDAAITAQVRTALADWVRDSNGRLTSFVVADVKRFTPTACDRASGDAWNEAAAQFPGKTFSAESGDHLLLMSKTDCGSFGLGTYSSASGMGSGGRVWFRESDPDGPLKYTRQVLVHEIGHNFRLGHAGRQTCDSASSCTADTYGNGYSVMGASYSNVSTSSLDSISREQLGTLQPCEQVGVSMPASASSLTGTWRIASRGSTEGIRGLVVTDPGTGVRTWVDWRDGTGQDVGSLYAGSSSWTKGLTLQQRRADDDTDTVLLRGVGSSAPNGLVAGASLRVGAVTVTSGTPSGGTIPVTVALAGSGSTAAPTMPGAVTITEPAVGGTVMATTTGYPSGTCHTLEWLRDGQPVSGASGTDLPVTSADVGHVLSARVTSYAPGYAPRVVTSPARGLFSRPAITSQGATGWVRVGAAVGYAPAADWPSARTQRWLVGETVVGEGATYVPTAADLASGQKIRLEVSFVAGGSPITVTSPPRGVAAGVLAARTPTIVGVRAVGRTLRAERGSWSPTPSFSYQWFADGKPIARATASTIKLVAAQRGKKISVWVTGRKAGYTTVKKGSARTGSIG